MDSDLETHPWSTQKELLLSLKTTLDEHLSPLILVQNVSAECTFAPSTVKHFVAGGHPSSHPPLAAIFRIPAISLTVYFYISLDFIAEAISRNCPRTQIFLVNPNKNDEKIWEDEGGVVEGEAGEGGVVEGGEGVGGEGGAGMYRRCGRRRDCVVGIVVEKEKELTTADQRRE